MNPVIFEKGPVVVHAYTAWLTGGILLGLGVLIWRAHRYSPDAVTRWLDVGIAAVLAGVIGARALHVAVEWDYFADHRDEFTQISLGGMAWHGGLLAAIPAALLAMWIRRVPFRAWTDAAALAWPVGMIAAWKGCRNAGCGYGYEVWTLADWPGWLVEELPDVYGLPAPRLDVQAGGMVFGGALLALALLLTWRDWLPGLRLWLVLSLSGLGLHLFGYFRADPSQTLFNRRADQIFDLIVLLLSTLSGITLWIMDRQNAAQMEAASAQTEGATYEDYAGTGPDSSQTR